MKTNNFYNNGSFNDKAMRGIKDAVYLAKRAYDNKDKLDDLSKPLNNIDTKKTFTYQRWLHHALLLRYKSPRSGVSFI